MPIITITGGDFERILALAAEYKNIELRLSSLELDSVRFSEIVNVAETTILTDVADMQRHFDINYVRKNLSSNSRVLVDIPLEHSDEMLRTLDLSGFGTLLSYHDFTGDTDLQLKNIRHCGIGERSPLEKILDIEHRFDYVKIAQASRNIAGVENLLSLLDANFCKGRLIIVPLGERWSAYRLESLRRGSVMMYCYVDGAGLYGQQPFAVVQRFCESIHFSAAADL